MAMARARARESSTIVTALQLRAKEGARESPEDESAP